MKISIKRLALAIAGAGMLTVYGCGGGGGGSSAETTVDVPITVIDGPIQFASVCLDKNSNGACDSGEPAGKTDAAGKVTLKVDAADKGKYPVIAVVGIGAIDSDRPNTPITVPFTLKAPADQTAVITPLTTLVHNVMESTGASSAAAETLVKAQTGINVSLFEDFSKGTSADHLNAATVARMVVVATQQQSEEVKTAEGTKASDDSTITKADLAKAIQKRLLEMLPALIAALADLPADATPAAKEEAFKTKATALIASDGLTMVSVATVVAINNQSSSTTAVASAPPSAGFTLANLNFNSATNFFARVFTASLAQSTPDASNNTKYVERRQRSNTSTSNTSNLAKWGAGSDPSRGADLHWNGSAWANCPINFENTSGVRDAQGNSSYNYCGNRETGKTNRATFDIAGKTLASVITDVRAAGYTNLSIGDNTANALTTALGSVTFPADSKLLYQTSTPLTNAISYYPGSGNPVGLSNVVSQYSPAVSAGGDATTQDPGMGCNSAEFQPGSNGSNSTTLEGMISAMTGTPCSFGPPGSFVYNNTTHTNPDPINQAWGNSTVSLGTLGTAPVGTGSTAPGFYSGNTRLRMAFKGPGGNPVTYYACKERFNNGSSRNCTAIGTGSYTIATLGDARVMTLNNLPAQTSPLTFTRVFVERDGLVYFGYQNRPGVFNSARLNTTGATALLNQLGVTPEDPAVPLALTAASYAGSYSGTFSGTDSGTFSTSISASGVKTCTGTSALAGAFTCTFTMTPATSDTTTAAITLGITGIGASYSGTVNFYTGAMSGTWVNGSNNGTFAGSRL